MARHLVQEELEGILKHREFQILMDRLLIMSILNDKSLVQQEIPVPFFSCPSTLIYMGYILFEAEAGMTSNFDLLRCRKRNTGLIALGGLILLASIESIKN